MNWILNMLTIAAGVFLGINGDKLLEAGRDELEARRIRKQRMLEEAREEVEAKKARKAARKARTVDAGEVDEDTEPAPRKAAKEAARS